MPMVVIRCRFQGQKRKRKSLVSLRFFMFFQLVSGIHLSRLLLAMYHQQEFLPGLTNKKILYLDLNAQHAWWYEFYLRLLFSPQLIDFISSTKIMYQVKKNLVTKKIDACRENGWNFHISLYLNVSYFLFCLHVFHLW